jgi:CRISPR-associated protein Csb1
VTSQGVTKRCSEAKFDAWLDEFGPAAVVLRESLMPVEGHDGVLFPATFAAAQNSKEFAGGYNINTFPDGTNVCLVDSVGSQANRIEPVFMKEGYAGLVPQVVVIAGERQVNLLEAGHRAGDAIVRCSELQGLLQKAFKALLAGDADPLAQVAPTSLVFGVWDSRDTQAKWPRLLASSIKAFNVRKLNRSAQYIPALEYVDGGIVSDPDKEADAKERNRLTDAYSERGFTHVPASWSHGGVIADGGVRRDAILSLAGLRLLAKREAGTLAMDRTKALRRYILGLSLTALTAPQSAYLRQGCNLVPDPDKPREFTLVHADGRREPLALSHAEALAFAKAAAKGYGVGENRTVQFDRAKATADVAPKEKGKGKGKKAAKDTPPEPA